MKRYFFNWPLLIVTLGVVAYAVYFSVFTIARVRGMYANYYDLGIMHQATYNSWQALSTGDWGLMLEQTNPFGPEQIKRMAIHTDFLMALIAPLYIFHDGPETLLVIQAITVALGAYAVYGIALHVFSKQKHHRIIALIFALCYLLNPLVQRATIYEFHSVTLATSFLLFMVYFWLKKKYYASFVFFMISILTKEQVALTTAFFALYVLFKNIQWKKLMKKKWPYLRSYHYSGFGLIVLSISIVWFILCMKFIIPYFRVDDQYHFALGFYGDYGDTPLGVISGILLNPFHIIKTFTAPDRLYYLFFHLGSLGFLSLLSPLVLFIAGPEFGITMLSSNGNMRNITLHYTAVITPFIFIAAVYGMSRLMHFIETKKKIPHLAFFLLGYIVIWTLGFAYFFGPLPGARNADTEPLTSPLPDYQVIQNVKKTFIHKDDKICTTGSLAPHFSGRRYFYDFSSRYTLADYVVVSTYEIYNGWGKDWMPGVYEQLVQDSQFKRIYEKNTIQVYQNTYKK